MEIKYCERCGILLGLVNPCRKYCKECRETVRRERQVLAKKGVKKKPETVPCAWCGKPMLRKSWSQKYHAECATEAQKALNRKLKAKKREEMKASGVFKADWDVKEPEPEPPKKHEPPKYTVRQMNDKAKQLGLSYGHYSTLLSQGKAEPPDER